MGWAKNSGDKRHSILNFSDACVKLRQHGGKELILAIGYVTEYPYFEMLGAFASDNLIVSFSCWHLYN